MPCLFLALVSICFFLSPRFLLQSRIDRISLVPDSLEFMVVYNIFRRSNLRRYA